MTDPQVFYNREDLWRLRWKSRRPGAAHGTLLHPDELPEADQLEYLLMTPFTPHNRDNMILDGRQLRFSEYGKMLFYELRRKSSSTAKQIEAMSDQNTTSLSSSPLEPTRVRESLRNRS